MQGRQTEQMSAEYVGLDTWPDERALAAMLDAQSRGVAAVRNAFADISKAATLVADKIRGGGRLMALHRDAVHSHDAARERALHL